MRGRPLRPLPAHEGSDAEGTEQILSGGRKYSDFLPRFLLKDGCHDHFKTSDRSFFKTEMLSVKPGSLLLI